MDINRQQLDPIDGISYETGVKGEFLEGRLNTSLALFQTRQNNLAEIAGVMPDNSTENYYRAVDGVRSQGYELEASGMVLTDWQLAASYTDLDIEDADTDKSLLPALNAVLERSSALLALPDSTLYRRNNIKAILITAFRQQRPIVGYSPAFVTAGALAALHTTPHQAARQTADLIIANGTNLPPPSGPTQFAVAINPNVAQALGLKVPDEAAIRRALLSDRESR